MKIIYWLYIGTGLGCLACCIVGIFWHQLWVGAALFGLVHAAFPYELVREAERAIEHPSV